jgi:hypothetical protein
MTLQQSWLRKGWINAHPENEMPEESPEYDVNDGLPEDIEDDNDADGEAAEEAD